jgi:soluble lytic murein transglycosylase-like protein
MRRASLLLILACATSTALADDAGRGRTIEAQPASAADMHALESAVRVAVWPMVGLSRNPAPPAAPTTSADQASQHGKPDAPGACDSRIDAEALKALVWKEAKADGVDPQLALTILSLESNDGRKLNSDRGARGPMQLIPSTAARYGVTDICDPQQNVRGAMLFLKDLVAQFQGNFMLVAAAYNAGPDRVFDARGVPAIAETVRYVASAANKYYGLSVFASRRKRAAAPPASSEPPVIVAEAADSGQQTQRPRQEWIGGSVLYVGDGDRR